jgi:hypothetical protein
MKYCALGQFDAGRLLPGSLSKQAAHCNHSKKRGFD